MRIWKIGGGDGQKTACFQDLLGDEDVLRQIASKSVTHGDLLNAPASFLVALAVIDRRMIHCGLNDIPFPRVILSAQLGPYLRKGDRSFIAEN
jgi:hypothetical protein